MKKAKIPVPQKNKISGPLHYSVPGWQNSSVPAVVSKLYTDVTPLPFKRRELNGKSRSNFHDRMVDGSL